MVRTSLRLHYVNTTATSGHTRFNFSVSGNFGVASLVESRLARNR